MSLFGDHTLSRIQFFGIHMLAIFAVFYFSHLAVAGDYRNSSHGSAASGVDRSNIDTKYSVFSKGNCAHCHEQHASLAGIEPNPVAGAASPYAVFANEENLCFECHDLGGPASTDIKSQYQKTNKHPKLSDLATEGIHRPWENTSADFTGTYRHAECTDCHNPHAATAANPLFKVTGVTPSNGGAGSLPSFTFGEVTDRDQLYKVCFKCHSNWTATTRLTAVQFNPANDSFHWVEKDKLTTYTPNSGSGKGIYYTAKFNLASAPTMMPRTSFSYTDANLRVLALRCSDCHGADSATALTPKGPHGSSVAKILKVPVGSTYTVWGPTADRNNAWCFNCHDRTPFISSSDTSSGMKNSSKALHELHARKAAGAGGRCVDCHLLSPHGQSGVGTANQRQHLLNPAIFREEVDNTTSGQWPQHQTWVIPNCT
ncbi:MAG: hypothetical protein CVU58_01310 [Deltaproteobacteria bacterium HGW-Deltaproteobacteria-16]|nr:MAG: hypothetical protein CVU58_01310 [Deltaproteobacteria bacterium HGW-Deltaproteobacteria-16]